MASLASCWSARGRQEEAQKEKEEEEEKEKEEVLGFTDQNEEEQQVGNETNYTCVKSVKWAASEA